MQDGIQMLPPINTGERFSLDCATVPILQAFNNTMLHPKTYNKVRDEMTEFTRFNF